MRFIVLCTPVSLNAGNRLRTGKFIGKYYSLNPQTVTSVRHRIPVQLRVNRMC